MRIIPMTTRLTTTRRMMLAGAGCALLSGCYRDRNAFEPVVIGGHTVSRSESIMDAIAASTDHRLLTDALRRSGLDQTLAGKGPLTLLAPTDAAFEIMRPREDAERFKNDPAYLELVLRGHVMPAEVTEKDIRAGIADIGRSTRVFPLSGSAIRLQDVDGELRAYDLRRRFGRISILDGRTSNGLIHVLDEVILPPEEDAA